MPPAIRRRDAEATRAAILDAARGVFGRDGYERTTIRAVAAEAGVDPALVMRYFETKAGLFARAVDLRLELPDLTGLTPTEMADALVDRFFEVWEEDRVFLALLRAAATSEVAAAQLREVFAHQAGPALARGAVDHPMERAAMAGAQVIGFAFARYVLRPPVLTEMDRAAVRRWLGPAIAEHLSAPR